jgi:hypothetical protein
MRRHTLGFGIAVASIAAAATMPLSASAASSTVVITPINAASKGWIIPVPGNGAVPYGWTGPADSAGGNESLHFGPISSADRLAKFEIEPPETNVPVSDFGGLSFEFQNIAGPTGHIYANAYVDSSANGIGFFGDGTSSTGFYDCRYEFTATNYGSGWNLVQITPSSLPGADNFRINQCAATIGGNVGGRIEFFRINAGDTSVDDAGLVGAFDLVKVTVAGSTTTYDFGVDANGDGVPDTAPPTSKDQCKHGGWASFNNPSFANQGDCVSFIATGGKNPPKG